MDKIKYECKQCLWQGFEYELDSEMVEGCFGEDKLEVCPQCGSQQVFILK